MKSLKNKTILITGAAGGFGREFTSQLLDLGAHLILTSRNADKLEGIAAEISAQKKSAPGKIVATYGSDLASPEGCRAAYEKCREISPDIDMLINNQGVITYGDFHLIPQDVWENEIEVNLLATMRMTHHFLPDMIARGSGHIVILSSISGMVGTAYSTAYAVTKWGLRGFGMALSGEVARHGIDVTNIYPFWVGTELLKSPVYGTTEMKKAHPFFIDDPKKVVAESIRAIRKGRLHVHPCTYAKAMNVAAKITPIVAPQHR